MTVLNNQAQVDFHREISETRQWNVVNQSKMFQQVLENVEQRHKVMFTKVKTL